MKAFFFVIALVALGGLYLIYIALKSYLLVRGAPREDMFICPKGHGPLPQSALIDFMGEKYCSICFHNNMKKAEKGML